MLNRYYRPTMVGMVYDRPDPKFPAMGMDRSLSIQTMADGPITLSTLSSHTENVTNSRLDGLGD